MKNQFKINSKNKIIKIKRVEKMSIRTSRVSRDFAGLKKLLK